MQRAIYKTHHHDAAFSYLAFRNLAVCVHSVSQCLQVIDKWLIKAVTELMEDYLL